jgi:hypothetical protein
LTHQTESIPAQEASLPTPNTASGAKPRSRKIVP